MSEAWRHTLLALIQGVTEFLPISSSAHLILAPKLLGWSDQGLAFDIAANTGTLLAVIWLYRQRLRAMAAAATGSRPPNGGSHRRLLLWLVVASVPLAVAGLLLQEWVATEARSVAVIAWATLGFGLLLGLADLRAGEDPSSSEGLSALGLRHALILGGAQALALIPGTSRSGITMTAALACGLRRRDAAEISFLMAIPAGLMVAAKDALDLASGRIDSSQWVPLLIAVVGSAVVGYLVMVWLLRWLQARSMMVFVVYRVLLGGALLLWLT